MMEEKRISPELFNKLGKGFGNALFESALDDKNKKAQNLALILGIALASLIIGIICLSGVEVTNLLFRKKFGKKGINWIRLSLAIICIIIIGVISYSLYDDFNHNPNIYISKLTFLVGAILNFLLALFLIVKGIYEKTKKLDDTFHPSYKGDSYLLKFLIADGWKQSKVQSFAEPLMLFSVGLVFISWNPIIGLPLFFCSLSSWLHQLWESVKGQGEIWNLLANEGQLYSEKQPFSDVVKS